MMVKKKRLVSKKIGRQSKKIGQRDKLLEFFFLNPSSKLSVREIAKKLRMSRSTVQYYLKQLKNEGLVSKDNQWVDNWQNRFVKSNYYVNKVVKSGLVDYLDHELVASSIILFGSVAKGESVKESDLDLFVECARNKKLDLKMFEKKLGHKVELFTKPKITLLPKNLFNNVVNGIKLKGYFKIK